MNPFSTLSALWPAISDASTRWQDAIGKLDAAELEQAETDPAGEGVDYHLVDVRDQAKRSRYRPSKRRRALGLPGRIKRTAYPPVDLSKRRVVLVIHQMGVVRTPAQLRRRAKLVTAQEVWGDGAVYIVHPDETHLIASNRFDREPYHSINFEFAGNFEGVAGSGRFFKPEQLGRSRMSAAWAQATSSRLTDKIGELRRRGIEPFMIAPHRVAGRDQDGNPNRQICCGSAQWKIAESVAAVCNVPVPGDDYQIGGLPIPAAWRSKFYAECRTVDA
ncbi:MAG: hypothetical protein ACRBN8_19900 [Nannocystales bacterium]